MIKKGILLLAAAFVLLPVLAGAQVNVDGSSGQNVDIGDVKFGIPGTHDPETEGPAALVANAYEFALLIGGLLAFGSIVYGGIQYLITAGNHSAQSEAKDRIRDALIGLLLLVGVYLVLNIINPDLTKLRFPTLQRLSPPETAPLSQFQPNEEAWGCRSTESGKSHDIVACWKDEASCKSQCEDILERLQLDTGVVDDWECVKTTGSQCNVQGGVDSGPKTNASCEEHKTAHPGANSCSESAGLAQVKGCTLSNIPGLTITTFQGRHAANSCHFGGRTCNDGSHALDVGINGARAASKNLPDVKATVEACGRINSEAVTCRYENSSGQTRSWGDPEVNHIHCNVNNAACNCM